MMKNMNLLARWIGYAVIAMVTCGGLWAGEAGVSELKQENAEFRQLLTVLGKGPVDVYCSEESLLTRKPSFASVVALRPARLFGKVFFRFRTAQGDVFLLSPGKIVSIRVPKGNGLRE